MSAHGWRVVVAAACLAGALAGCRSMLEIPDSARARGYANEEAPDGWLFDRITGRTAEAAGPEASVSRPDASSRVQPASNVEPIPPEGFDPSSPGRPIAASDAESEQDEDSGFQLSDFYPSNVLATIKEIAGYGPNEAVARALYQEGEYLVRAGRHKEAAERFQKAAKRAPESPLQEDCLFMAAESLFFVDRYPEANETYAELLEKYDNTRYLATVAARQFSMGRYWEQLDAAEPAWPFGFQWSDPTRPKFDTWGRAIKTYRSVQMHDPTGPLADDSVMAAADAYFVKGRYEDAAYHYDLLFNEYPKSEHQLNARLLGMRSKLQIYQGPMYDGKALEDAGDIAEQTLVLYGSELGSERERLVQTQNRIRQQRAERDWAIAQYYDRKRYYRAARIYYQSILDEYPLTAVAQKANTRLREIRDLPDEPPNYFRWLTDLFPSTTD